MTTWMTQQKVTPIIIIQMISAAVYKTNHHNEEHFYSISTKADLYRNFNKRHLDDVYNWKSQNFKKVLAELVTSTKMNTAIK